MKKSLRTSFLLLILIFHFISQSTTAQLVLTESVLTDRFNTTEDITSYETESTIGLQVLVDANGGNQTWDFSAISPSDTSHFVQSIVTLPADLPGADLPEFASAQFVEFTYGVADGDTLKSYLYQSLDSGDLHSHGIVFVGPENGVQDTVVSIASPPALDGVLPTQFGLTYSDSTTLFFEGEAPLTYDIIDVSVDGWGTLVTPERSAPALRMLNHERTYLLATGALLSEYYSIDFITAEGIVAEIELDDAMQPENASYSIFGQPMTLGAETTDEVPFHFALAQNFPNPFNPSTNIEFTLFEPAQATLKVYSITGQLLETLVDGFIPAGVHQASFDASDLASGVYLYRFESNGKSQSRFMSLLK